MSWCVIVANRMPCFVATAPNVLYELLINLNTPFPKILDTPLISTQNVHSPNPDLIQINPNPLPEVMLIQIDLDRAIAPYT